MSQQSDMADEVYRRLSAGPVSVASLVRELRERWGTEFGPSAVHGFIAEVSRCTIDREGVQLGSISAGHFKPWPGELCDIDDRFEEEMMSLDAFLEDEHRYVFAKKMADPAGTDNDGAAPRRV
jgi:hypothetical protein